MKILLIHQNFPGQWKYLGPALAAAGHEVTALTPKVKDATTWQGIRVLPYAIGRGNGRNVHPWVIDLETKVVRAQACFEAALGLKAQGYSPDVILAHHGWGEPMFLKDAWPEARMGLYCELFHSADYPHLGFDPEFPVTQPLHEKLRMRIRNLNNVLHLDACDAGLSPTRFQADTFPPDWRARISVIHDGIDTELLRPDPQARFDLPGGGSLTRADEVITFVNRNLEPYRGYHSFMRALPGILRRRPQARVLILGEDGVSYGARPPKGQTWKQIYIDEVRGQIPDTDWARVQFLGRIPYDSFLRLVQVSRVHVYLTYPFVLSWSLLEAMSAGAAILASDTAPVAEAVTDGQTGLLTDFFDTVALTDRLCHLLDDDALRARLGAAARDHVVRHYDLRSTCLPAQLAWVDALARG